MIRRSRIDLEVGNGGGSTLFQVGDQLGTEIGKPVPPRDTDHPVDVVARDNDVFLGRVDLAIRAPAHPEMTSRARHDLPHDVFRFTRRAGRIVERYEQSVAFFASPQRLLRATS